MLLGEMVWYVYLCTQSQYRGSSVNLSSSIQPLAYNTVYNTQTRAVCCEPRAIL